MKTEKNILIAFLLNLSFAVFEFAGGIWSGSVAILSDAVHDLGDAAGIGISWLLERKSRRAPDEVCTYGYGRYSVLGSLITTAILLCCVGTLSMMGPVLCALKGDNTYLMTCATLNLVTMIVIASSYGFGTAVTGIVVFLWQSAFYGIAHMSESFISDELVAETSIVGGVLIAAAGLGVLNIKDCKTINLLPALVLPMLFFLIKGGLGL